MFDAEFWVGLAFLVFVGVLVYFKVPGMLTRNLDERAQRIRRELDEAQKLREETQAMLATYERRQREAMKEAEAMIAHARDEARRESEQARLKLEETVRRREQLAVEKIALAEAQAEKEVRDSAVEIAIAAARQVIAAHLTGERAAGLVDDSIKDLRRRLN